MNYGRYEVVKEVGKGSMGVVYEAHDPDIDRKVALKVLRQDRLTSEAFVERFLKEAKAIGRLSHQDIVTVYDVGQDRGTVYITMEFATGISLDRLAQEKRLRFDQMVNIGIQVAETLDYAHQRGIIHRDIKPSNIIISHGDRVKITDFGIAHIEDPAAPQQTQAGEILGTPAYMAPEQAMGQPVDGRSDLFSLGAILYELATGSRPFRGENLAALIKAVADERPVEPIRKRAEIPRRFSDTIMKCLEKNPDKRFQTGRELVESLQSCLSAEAPLKVKRRRLLSFASMGAILVVVSVIAGFFLYLSLTPKAMLDVKSMPSGAQVIVDGAFKGKSPIKLKLPLGKHEVRLVLSNYYDWEAQVQLEEGEIPLTVRLIPIDEE
ncbi:MAG: protein kinase domain-containing protein [bacterium]